MYLVRMRAPQGKQGNGAKKSHVVDKPDPKKMNQEKSVPRSEFHTVRFRRRSSCRWHGGMDQQKKWPIRNR